MTDVIQAPSAPESPSTWWQTALTILIAVVAVGGGLTAIVLTIWGVVEDDPVLQGRLNPRVFDDARLLTPATIARIESTVFPPDVPVIVRTVERLDGRVAAAEATDRMEREAAWRRCGRGRGTSARSNAIRRGARAFTSSSRKPRR